MIRKSVTEPRSNWRLSAQEVAHAMPVLQWVHPGLRTAPAPRLVTIWHLAQRCGIRTARADSARVAPARPARSRSPMVAIDWARSASKKRQRRRRSSLERAATPSVSSSKESAAIFQACAHSSLVSGFVLCNGRSGSEPARNMIASVLHFGGLVSAVPSSSFMPTRSMPTRARGCRGSGASRNAWRSCAGFIASSSTA